MPSLPTSLPGWPQQLSRIEHVVVIPQWRDLYRVGPDWDRVPVLLDLIAVIEGWVQTFLDHSAKQSMMARETGDGDMHVAFFREPAMAAVFLHACQHLRPDFQFSSDWLVLDSPHDSPDAARDRARLLREWCVRHQPGQFYIGVTDYTAGAGWKMIAAVPRREAFHFKLRWL